MRQFDGGAVGRHLQRCFVYLIADPEFHRSPIRVLEMLRGEDLAEKRTHLGVPLNIPALVALQPGQSQSHLRSHRKLAQPWRPIEPAFEFDQLSQRTVGCIQGLERRLREFEQAPGGPWKLFDVVPQKVVSCMPRVQAARIGHRKAQRPSERDRRRRVERTQAAPDENGGRFIDGREIVGLSGWLLEMLYIRRVQKRFCEFDVVVDQPFRDRCSEQRRRVINPAIK